MGVKSGLKDVARVLNVPFETINNISKEIDKIPTSKAQPKFSDYDKLKEGTAQEQEFWKMWNKLEKDNNELFRLARCFEGSPRNFGVHASGILVTPMPVEDLFPTRLDLKKGNKVTLYTGPQLEELQAIKLDMLGLRSLDVIVDCLKHIDKELEIDDLYRDVDIEDPALYKYLSTKETEGIFQLESNMMKGLVGKIKPTCFEDVVAITALGRPGPLSAGFDNMFAEGKNGGERKYPIRGCEDILDKTYGIPVYQESLMQISKKVSGFDDLQADSITRKLTAKKVLSMFPMMKRCHIYGKKNCEGPEGWENDNNAPWYDPKGKYGGEIPGALSNGYTAEELNDYFKSIEGFASYAFNKSHAVSYTAISAYQTFLKKNYPVEYMAALLSNQETEEDVNLYVSICENNLGIHIEAPDINRSEKAFTPDPEKNCILIGLGAVKNVGDTSLPDLLKNRPYASLKDCIEKNPKKVLNKRAGINLIKAGAFDSFDENRCRIINQFYKIRKDKDEPLNEEEYGKEMCIEFEKETLGVPVTYKPWWEAVKPGTYINEEKALILKINEVKDRNGHLMAFLKLQIKGCDVEAICFASKYIKYVNMLNRSIFVSVSGKKEAGKKAGEYQILINSLSKADTI